MQKTKRLEKLSDFGGIIEVGAWVFSFLALVCTGLKILTDSQVKILQAKEIGRSESSSEKIPPVVQNNTTINVGRDYYNGGKKEVVNNNYNGEREFNKKDGVKLIKELKQINLDSNTNYNHFSILYAIGSNGQKFGRGMQKYLQSKGFTYNNGGMEAQPFDGYKLIAEENEIRIIIGSF